MKARRVFLVRREYTPRNEDANTRRAQRIVRALFAHFVASPDRLPADVRPRDGEEIPRRVAGFVACMTDRSAIDPYEQIVVPQNWSV